MYLIGIDYENKNSKEVLKAHNKLLRENIKVKLIEDPKELVESIVNNNEVLGGIRGTLPSSEVVTYLKKHIGKFYRASILKNPFNGDYFFLAPVGIDEVDEKNSFKDKIAIITYILKFLKNNELSNSKIKIGILSGGRLSDYGRSERINYLIDEAENIVKYINKKYGNDNILIAHKGILIEEYLKEGFNIIVAPDGISGNLIFRCLALLCEFEGCGALILGKKNIRFMDTSRSGKWNRYYNSLKFLMESYK